MKRIVILALCIAILMSASAMAAMQCSVVPFNNCPQTSVKIIGMTSLSNDGSHASIPSDQANALVACCRGVEGLSVEYSQEEADIYLTEARNAHVSRVEGENGIKINGVSCGYFNDCNENACVFSISADRDAHISDCNNFAFSRKLCCNEGPLIGEELAVSAEEVPEISERAEENLALEMCTVSSCRACYLGTSAEFDEENVIACIRAQHCAGIEEEIRAGGTELALSEISETDIACYGRCSVNLRCYAEELGECWHPREQAPPSPEEGMGSIEQASVQATGEQNDIQTRSIKTRRIQLPDNVRNFLRNFLRGGLVGSFLRVPQ
jgi:hypothetical protein